MEGHVTKPFKQSDLHGAIQRVVTSVTKPHRATDRPDLVSLNLADKDEPTHLAVEVADDGRILKVSEASAISPCYSVTDNCNPAQANITSEATQQSNVSHGHDLGNPPDGIIDLLALEKLALLISFERLLIHVQELEIQFAQLLELEVEHMELQAQAHKIASQAGAFGLIRVLGCARDLEEACRSGKGREAALTRCRAAAGDVKLYAQALVSASTKAKFVIEVQQVG